MFSRRFKSIIVAGLLATGLGVQAQGLVEEAPEKGQLNEVSSYKAFNFEPSAKVYNASASEIAAAWDGDDWSLSGSTVTTGVYGPNAELSIQSQSIALPVVEEGTDLVLTIKEKFSLESNYDFGQVLVSADNGASWAVIGSRTGKSALRAKQYILSSYAGSNVQLAFQLVSDDSFESSGWDVLSVAIAEGTVSFGAAKPAVQSSLLKAEGDVEDIRVTSVHDDNFPEYVYIDFEYEVNGEFTYGLTLSQLNLTENGIPQNGCTRLWGPAETSTERVLDLVFIIDNSGSLSDEQDAVLEGIEYIVDNIQGASDPRFALVRFGDSGLSMPWVQIENGLTDPTSPWEEDADNFKTVLGRNRTNGGTERGYDAMTVTTDALSPTFRQNAEVIYILVTDENATGANLGTVSKADAVASLQNAGVRLFSIVPDEVQYDVTYNDVAVQTNGEIYPLGITDAEIEYNFQNIVLPGITSSIVQKYTLRYCPSYVDVDGVERTVEVSLVADPTVVGTGTFTPELDERYLDRDAQTQTYDYTYQADDLDLDFTFVSRDEMLENPVVTFYYKDLGATTWSTALMEVDVNTPYNATEYHVTIDAAELSTPGLNYYAVARYTDGVEIKSPPVHEEFFAYTVAVWPNMPPMIDASLIPETTPVGEALEVSFTVMDATFYIDEISFFYREIGAPTVFKEIPVTLTGSTFQSVDLPLQPELFQDAGIEYYITAVDNHGVLGIYGESTNPHEIRTVADQIIIVPTSLPFTLDLGDVTYACEPLQPGDKVVAYYEADDNSLVPIGMTEVTAETNSVSLTAYGDDSGAAPKNGYANNEEIKLKVIRGGSISEMAFKYYTPRYYAYTTNVSGYTVGAKSQPVASVMNNEEQVVILNGDNTPIYEDGTDFGFSSFELTQTFTIVNDGCEAMNIESVTISDENNFAVQQPYTNYVSENGSVQFVVKYNDNSAEAQATVEIKSNGETFTFDVKAAPVTNTTGGNVYLAVSPNPVVSWANAIYQLNGGGQEHVTLAVYDVYGGFIMNVYEGYLYAGSQNPQYMDVNTLQPGTYLLRVTTDTGVDAYTQFIKM